MFGLPNRRFGIRRFTVYPITRINYSEHPNSQLVWYSAHYVAFGLQTFGNWMIVRFPNGSAFSIQHSTVLDESPEIWAFKSFKLYRFQPVGHFTRRIKKLPQAGSSCLLNELLVSNVALLFSDCWRFVLNTEKLCTGGIWRTRLAKNLAKMLFKWIILSDS